MVVQTSFKKLFLITGFAVLSLPILSSCELTQNYMKHDRENSMEPQDYRDALAPREVEIEDSLSKGKAPALKPYITQPDSNYKPMPLVSVSVNQTIPLRDVIYEITQQAGYEAEIDPRIKGAIIFSARNRPLDMVIDRISDIAGLRYKFEDDMLRVELDTPYHEIYKINYLALTRTNMSTISNDISVVSGDGADTGSAFSAKNESVLDFWKELETNLTQIVESNRDSARLATSRDPRVTVAEANPAPVEPIMIDDNGNISETGPNVQVQAPQAVLNVSAIEEEEDQNSGDEDPFAARFSLNKQAGIISVFAPQRLHKEISRYLDEVKKSASAQVLIEAKVLEVSLNDSYAAGIDWSQVDINLFGGQGALGFRNIGDGLIRGVLSSSGSDSANSTVSYSKGNFSAAVDALAEFGTVQALASPRLTVLNNQSAALNVVENSVYFEIEVESSTSDAGTVVTFETDIKSVPEGVLINVQPAIDLDLDRVAMAIRPTITTITRTVQDPNPNLRIAADAAAGTDAFTIESRIPVVNVQEFDSVISVDSGQAVVLGGLIQDRVESIRTSVPVLGEMPLFGAAFRRQQDSISKTELVVFLKATIVDGNNTITNTDKDLYRTFSSDRRPLKL